MALYCAQASQFLVAQIDVAITLQSQMILLADSYMNQSLLFISIEQVMSFTLKELPSMQPALLSLMAEN